MYNQYYPNYLMHHGVKGMRWGFRKKRELSNRNISVSKTQQQAARKEKIKKAAIVGGAVAAAGLAVYGGYKLKSTRDFNKAAVARFLDLDGNQTFRSSVINETIVKTPWGERVPAGAKPFVGVQNKGSTLSRAKITRSIKGPSLTATRSSVQGFEPGTSRLTGTKMLENFSVGNRGRNNPVIMSKADKNYYKDLYNKAYSMGATRNRRISNAPTFGGKPKLDYYEKLYRRR